MKNISALIIDDSEIDRYILNRQLEEAGVTNIIQVDDGASALEFLKNHAKNKKQIDQNFPPVVIFLDINMPMIGGFEFLEKFAELRGQLELEACVIMMYSSSEREEDREKALHYDFVKDYLVKGGFTLDELKEKVLTLQ